MSWDPDDDDRRAVHIAREKAAGRELRRSSWWKNKLAEGRCHYCEKAFAPEELTMDHIVPLSRGGKSSRGNVIPACKECNTAKNSQTPVELLLGKGVT